MNAMNLDGKMMNHHDRHQKKGDRMNLNRESHLMMVCLKKISVMKSANYYRHDCLDVSLNNYLRTYLFLISLVVARYLVVLCNILFVAGVTYETSV
jgi:hypothetical protein